MFVVVIFSAMAAVMISAIVMATLNEMEAR